MLNYIKSELYRTTHRKYPYIVVGVLSLICILGNILAVWVMKEQPEITISMSHMLMISTGMFTMIYYAVIMIVDIVFSDEYKHQTLKNTVSFGINRTKIYLGKFISEIIVAIVSLVIVTSVIILSSYIFLGSDGVTTVESLKNFGTKLIAVFPLWVVGLAIANLLAFNIKNNNTLAFAYLGVVAIFPGIVSMLADFKPIFAKLQSILVSNQIKFIMSQEIISGGDIAKCYILGIIYVILITAIGMVSFRRGEIK
ncbi:ABC transporter permease subunit [Clostridium sp.]|uniref:ABC transporter permease subunit n=1 Tax=Clostridium sp. TaxID=1506 RepID=UPI0034640EAF